MRTLAKYKGYVLNATRKSNGKVLIWGTDKQLLKFNFNEDKTDDPVTYDRIVDKPELEELYREDYFGMWNGMEFYILGEDENSYVISYSYHDYIEEAEIIKKCEAWGMKKTDRNFYEKDVPKSEIANLRIERKDLLHKKNVLPVVPIGKRYGGTETRKTGC